MKKIILLIVIMISFTLVACNDTKTPSEPVKLAIPEVSVSETGKARWEKVKNASSYVYKINNEEVAPETPIANFGIYDVQLTDKSPLCGISMVEAKIPENYSSMVIAIERNGEYLDQLNSIIFQPGDKVHFVGPKDTIHSLA